MKFQSTVEEVVWCRVYATEFARIEGKGRADLEASGSEESYQGWTERLLQAAQDASLVADESIVALRRAREEREG